MNQYVVIDKISKKVLRYGFCNFDIDPSTEQLLNRGEIHFVFFPDLDCQDWFYSEASDTFVEVL